MKRYLAAFMLELLFIACSMVPTVTADDQEKSMMHIEEQEEKEIHLENQEEKDPLKTDTAKENINAADQLLLQEEGKELLQEKETENVANLFVRKTFATKLPESIRINLKYDQYPISYDYFVVLRSNIHIREKPSTNASVVRIATIFEKLNLLEEVQGEYLEKYKTNVWYRVSWKDSNEVKTGYVFGPLGDARKFQFDKMKEAIERLKVQVDGNVTAFISNYKNRNGAAPKYKGKEKDFYGTLRYQGAPGYTDPNSREDFRYFSDGTLVTVLDENDDFYKVSTLNFEGVYWIPKKYVSFRNSIKELTKAIVVDRLNQNQGTFEYMDGGWNLVSYTMATTGVKAKYKFETPLGYYMAIEKKPQFLYLDDVTKEIAGYAPYAIRFTGGAYIHGIPVDFIMKEGQRIDPGHKEYLFTVGTKPRSHKCVRNYTSHAEFLYNWIDIGKSAIIVIE